MSVEMNEDTKTQLLHVIAQEAKSMGLAVFVVGGAVRDHLQGRRATDIDLAVSADPFPLGRRVAGEMGATFIILDEVYLVGRLVWHGEIIDLACFKGGVATIAEDLGQRDFTVNSMAFSLVDWLAGADPQSLVDPYQGEKDLSFKQLRLVYDGAMADDPLRIMRGYRFRAQTGFSLDADFTTASATAIARLDQVAVERLVAELQLIFASARAGMVMEDMAHAGILQFVFPELAIGHDVSQPGSHHLDVLAHNLEALSCLEKVLADLERFFGEQASQMKKYVADQMHHRCLKWAALFHDVGKVATRGEKEGRITFYQHDQHGAALFKREIAPRLKLPKHDAELVALFISQHMRPFHLCNIKRQGPVSVKACLRLAKALGDHIPGLFLLAMADSLAGDGEDKPADMEGEIASLFALVWQVMESHITPVLSAPLLLDGQDLINAGLDPGPLFKEIFSELELLQVTGDIISKKQAFAWLVHYTTS